MKVQTDLFGGRFESRRRPLPRPFEFPWGTGQVVEEVGYRGSHHEPAIQLLRFEDGRELVRFCTYTLRGRYERDSWLAGREELEGLGRALDGAPRLAQLLGALLVSSR
jgi:hypothetical protein